MALMAPVGLNIVCFRHKLGGADAARELPVVLQVMQMGDGLAQREKDLAGIELAAEKAGWGQPLPERVGRGVSLQFDFGTYMAQVAEVEVLKNGAVRVRRVVCAVDCGTVVNPDTVEAQIQGAIIFGITAALAINGSIPGAVIHDGTRNL